MEELIKRLERVIATGAPDKDGQHPISAETVLEVVKGLSEHSTNLASLGTDCISRQQAIDALNGNITVTGEENAKAVQKYIRSVSLKIHDLPSAQPEKEIAKRVLWSGWKGTRDTRYKCPMCKKPVKNDDVYCHRCGQKLMFPHISFTDYVPGEKQETIVRWDDE